MLMIKNIVKGFMAAVLTLAMIVTTIAVTPTTAMAMQHEEYIRTADVISAGWIRSGDNARVFTMNSVVYVGDQLSGNNVQKVTQPGLPMFDWEDDISFTPLNGIVESASIQPGTNGAKGYFVITPVNNFVGNTGNSVTVTFTKENVKLDKHRDEMGADSYYTFIYRLEVRKGAASTVDPLSISQGWTTADGGQSYTRTYDTYQLAESDQGTTVSVVLPTMSSNGIFDNGDVVAMDNTNFGIIRGVRIDPISRFAYVSIAPGLSYYNGRSVNLVLSKYVTNDQGVNARYTLTIPFRVGAQAAITVNGYRSPSTITVTQGDAAGLKVANIIGQQNAVVHWTTDATGRYDIINMNTYPMITNNSVIYTHTMNPGTYYFYISTSTGQNSGVFTLKVEAKKAPNPVPTMGIIYRIMDPVTEERLLTTSANEVGKLQAKGWLLEASPGYSGGNVAVYRLYNIKTGEHLYTSDLRERTYLTQREWIYDNNGRPMFYAAKSGSRPMYRLYNNRKTPQGSHLYTSDQAEVRRLTANHGWTYDNAGRPYFYLQ